MAPTTTIETITITRPLKVIAFICGLIVIVLMVMALTSTDWLLSTGWRQGLFVHCVSEKAAVPLPFNIVADVGCYDSRDACIYLTQIYDFFFFTNKISLNFSLYQSHSNPMCYNTYHRCNCNASYGNRS